MDYKPKGEFGYKPKEERKGKELWEVYALKNQYINCRDSAERLRDAKDGKNLRWRRKCLDFCIGYETGRIKSFWDFYKRPSEIRDEWYKMGKEEYEKALKEYEMQYM